MSPPRTPALALPASQLSSRLRGGVPRVVVLAGAERWFRETALREIVAQLLPAGDPGASFLRLDAKRPEDREGVGAALDELRSSALFGGTKVVAIDHPESAGGRWAEVARQSPVTVLARAALGAPSLSGVLVLLTPRPTKGREAVPTKTLVDAGALVVDCRALYDAPGPWQRGAPPHDHELARFLARQMAELHQRELGLLEAHAITRLVGSDLGELHDALASLALYLGERQAVTADDIDAVLGATRTDPAWHLVDAVYEGDVARAVDLLQSALRRGLADARGASGVRGDEAVFAVLAAALHAEYRRILAAAEALAAGEAPAEVTRGLGVPSFRAETFLARCRRDPRALLATHGAFLDAEWGVKGGRVPAGTALERLVVRLAQQAAGVPGLP